LLSTLWICGCGGDSSATQAESSAANGGKEQVAGPQEAVAEYLEAVKLGDAETVNRLLTTAAREKTTELNIAVAPPGSETAEYQVGSSQLVDQEGETAHVESSWSDLNADGEREEYQITWILRLEPQGWRVAGMMGQFIKDGDMMVFNFENPQEVIRQQDYAQQELERRAAQQRQAQSGSESQTR
jgi:hypothetical protein